MHPKQTRMNIQEFIERIETHTPDGYEFWCGINRQHYNTVKQVRNVMVLVLPRTWPSAWRGGCSKQIRFDLWLGRVVPVKQRQSGTQQHTPYSGVELVAEMHDVGRETLHAIGTDTSILIAPDPDMTFYDAPEGQGVNQQAWLQIPITAEIWK